MGRALLTAGEAQTNHRYDGATRIGVVIARRTGKTGPQVRVQYPDRGVGSAWTPVAQRNTVGSKDYNLPRLGERVLVHHFANGPERAIVTGCVFNEAVSAAPQGNPDNRQVVFDDGTLVEYDPGAKTMKIDAAGNIAITTVGPISIDAQGAITITAPATVDTRAPKITLHGDVDVNGNLTVAGNIAATGDPAGTLSITGNINHTGDMQTSGTHRDSRGYHTE